MGTADRARWAEGGKASIATAIGERSRVWFSLAHGRMTEVFYPTPDRACVRSLGCLVVHDGRVMDEADWIHEYVRPYDDVPLLAITNRDPDGRFEIRTETITDPRSDTVLQRVRWAGTPGARVYCCLEPALDNAFDDTQAAVLDDRCERILTAERRGVAAALACTRSWRACGAARICTTRDPAEIVRRGSLDVRAHGHVVLVGELDFEHGDECVLALAFAHSAREAAHAALGALARGYESICDDFVREWRRWSVLVERRPTYRWWTPSVAVLKTLEAKCVDGGRVAALSTPWGRGSGPGIADTYHVAWTRDLVHCMGGLLAAGIHDEARQTLAFLRITQHPDGHWPQNMLLDGERVRRREEVDESAAPILLVDLLRREQALDENELERAWPMVSRAADHLIRVGPSTALDRWEDTAGVTPYTIASEVAALACASELASLLGDDAASRRYRTIAERWNHQIEPLLYRRGSRLAERLGLEGYYVRARRFGDDFASLEGDSLPSTEIGVDALALVRFGLRSANDPRILDTVRAIDAVLAVDLPLGRVWRRYVGDRYGEHADGAPFDGDGIGRPWPLLVAERAHYELARGDLDRARELLRVMEHCATPTGMLPEQIWDGRDIPERGLVLGGPTGSAAPLGWAHAEYVKLCRSVDDARIFDLPMTAL